MSTRQLPEFGTFRCSGSSVHSRFLGPGVIPKTLWNCVWQLHLESWLHRDSANHPPQKKYHYRAPWLLFKIRPSASLQPSRTSGHWGRANPSCGFSAEDVNQTKDRFSTFFNMYLGIKWYKTIISPKKWWDYVYIYICISPNSGTIPTSNPIISDVHETQRTHMEASWDWGVNNKHRSFVFNYHILYLSIMVYISLYLIILYWYSLFY